MEPPPPGARSELLSSLLTPVYIAGPLLAIAALAVVGVTGAVPALGLVIGAVVCAVLALRMLPLTWVRTAPDRLYVRGLWRSCEVPFAAIAGIEVSRFGGGLSLMREVTVHVVGAGGVDQVRFVGHLGFGADAAAAQLASAIDGWRASGGASRG